MIVLKRIYRLSRVLVVDWTGFFKDMRKIKDRYNNHIGWLAWLWKVTPLIFMRLFINTLIFFYNLYLILTNKRVNFDRNMEVLELTLGVPPYRYRG